MAAGIPLLLALTAVFATFGLIALPSHVFPVAMQAPALVLLIGLAVGVDYSMFYLKREREERAAGRSEQAALEAAAATSGRSVLISGLTVIVAMAGMFLTGDPTFESLGIAAITVVAIAVLGSLTVLPALLSRLGDKVDRGRVPLVGRSPKRRREPGLGRDRRPRPAPARSCRSSSPAGCWSHSRSRRSSCGWSMPGPDTFPQSLPAVQAYERMQQAFPGTALPGQRRRQGAERERTCGAGRRFAGSSSGQSRPAGCTSRSRSTSTATRPSRTSRSRSTARRPTGEVGRGARGSP